MPEVKLNHELHKVEIIESERGWGQKLDEVKYFTSQKRSYGLLHKLQ